MKSILLVNGAEELSISQFLKKFSVDQQEIETLKALPINQDHFIVYGNDFIAVTKIPDLTPFEKFQMEKHGNILGRDAAAMEEEPIMSTSEEAYIYSLENPEA